MLSFERLAEFEGVGQAFSVGLTRHVQPVQIRSCRLSDRQRTCTAALSLTPLRYSQQLPLGFDGVNLPVPPSQRPATTTLFPLLLDSDRFLVHRLCNRFQHIFGVLTLVGQDTGDCAEENGVAAGERGAESREGEQELAKEE